MATKRKKTAPPKDESSLKDVSGERTNTPGPFTLRAIYLKNCEMRMPDTFDPLIPQQMMHAFNKVHTGNAIVRETFFTLENGEQNKIKSATFGVSFSFGYRRHESIDDSSEISDDDFLAFISAEIVADYLITSDENPTNEQLTQWGQKNALIHCWPYWREFCSNAQLRMALPVTMIPLINIR